MSSIVIVFYGNKQQTTDFEILASGLETKEKSSASADKLRTAQ